MNTLGSSLTGEQIVFSGLDLIFSEVVMITVTRPQVMDSPVRPVQIQGNRSIVSHVAIQLSLNNKGRHGISKHTICPVITAVAEPNLLEQTSRIIRKNFVRDQVITILSSQFHVQRLLCKSPDILAANLNPSIYLKSQLLTLFIEGNRTRCFASLVDVAVNPYSGIKKLLGLHNNRHSGQ